MLKYPHHEKVLKILNLMSSDILDESSCFFGGGTAISLLNGEHRVSVDIDFLCPSEDGFRKLRSMVTSNSLGNLIKVPEQLKIVRDVRTDRDGIRTLVEVDNVSIKIEIIRTARTDLTGEKVKDIPVTVLDRTNLYAEKLMANADRGLDKATLYRDMIDMLAMELTWKSNFPASWRIAKRVYGNDVEKYQKVQDDMKNHPELLKRSFEEMQIDEEWQQKLLKKLNQRNTKAINYYKM